MKKTSFLLLFFCAFLHAECQHLIPYKKGDLFGYSTMDGKMAIDPIYEKAELFNPKGYAIVSREGKESLVDTLGKVMVVPGLEEYEGKFDLLDGAYGKYYRFKVGEYAGILDSTLAVVCKEICFSVNQVKGGQYFIVRKKVAGKSVNGLVDKKGDLIIAFEEGTIGVYSFFEKDKPSIFYRQRKGKYQFYDKHKQAILDTGYTKINVVLGESEGLILCYRGEELDVYDDQFNLLYADFNLNAFRAVADFQKILDDGKIKKKALAKLFKTNYKVDCWSSVNITNCICIDSRDKIKKHRVYVNGKAILQEEEQFLHVRKDLNLIFYKQGDEKGVRNIKNKEVLPLGKHSPLSAYGIRRLLVRKGNDFQFYTIDGEKIDKLNYSFANGFSLRRKTAPEYAFHNGNGEPLTAFVYDTIFLSKAPDLFFAKKGNHYFLLDTLGMEVKKMRYDAISKMEQVNRYLVERSGKKGVITGAGDLLIPLKYDTISLLDKYARNLFIVKEGALEKLVNAKHKVIKTNLAEVKGRNIMPFIEGYFMLDYKDGSREFFSPNGERTLLLNKGQGVSLNERMAKLGFFRTADYYCNYTTGTIYKD